MKTVTLHDQAGNVVEEVRISGNLPKVVLWGIDIGRRRVFLLDKGTNYRETSWFQAPLTSYAGIGV